MFIFFEFGNFSSDWVGKFLKEQNPNVKIVAETGDYLVFVLNKNHAQVYDKRTISGGTEAEFREFLMEVIGKPVQYV